MSTRKPCLGEFLYYSSLISSDIFYCQSQPGGVILSFFFSQMEMHSFIHAYWRDTVSFRTTVSQRKNSANDVIEALLSPTFPQMRQNNIMQTFIQLYPEHPVYCPCFPAAMSLPSLPSFWGIEQRKCGFFSINDRKLDNETQTLWFKFFLVPLSWVSCLVCRITCTFDQPGLIGDVAWEYRQTEAPWLMILIQTFSR